jgi:DNA-binding winged helix-turn-helix (wHTH) protein/Flp pilus assembly protein TadD
MNITCTQTLEPAMPNWSIRGQLLVTRIKRLNVKGNSEAAAGFPHCHHLGAGRIIESLDPAMDPVLPASTQLVRFGAFEADLIAGELRKDGVKLKLQELPFRLLACLLERQGELVTREDLQSRLWSAGTHVDFDHGLKTALNKLRDALEDTAVSPRLIETIPRRGYRFIGEVERSAEASRARLRRKYILAAAGVTAVLAATGAFSALQTRSKPLTDRDVLVLADFSNSTGDPVFDNVLHEALAYQLEQSPFLKVLDDGVMRQDLQLMRRSPQEHITNDVAHDICVRENEKAMLGGSIASLGHSYAIELKATNCGSGATLAREYSDAADKEHVLQALAKAAQGMRAKLGESLSSIEKLAPPVKLDVTTGSLEAFQSFSAGAQLYAQGRFSEAIPALQRATDLDPDFAIAWLWLATTYLNSGGSRQRSQEYADRAWALRARVSAKDRLWITSSRDGQTAGQYMEDFETWARTYPREAYPVISLGRLHASAGEFEQALAEFQEAYRLQPHRYPIEIVDLVMMYSRLDRFGEAQAAEEKMLASGVDGPTLHLPLLVMAYAQGDQDGAAKQIAWFAGKPEEYFSVRAQAAESRTRGQLRRSRELLQRAAELTQRRNLPQTAAAGYLQADSGGDALVGNCQAARNYPNEPPTSALPVGVFGMSDAALALCGSPALAERAEALNRQWVNTLLANPARVPLRRAAVQLGLGNPNNAIEFLQAVSPYERAYPMSNYIRGLAYLKLKEGAEAAGEFQKILNHRGANWGPLYPLAFVGVARGAVLIGDTASARKGYENFFALWKDADADVPILIQARKEYANLPR